MVIVIVAEVNDFIFEDVGKLWVGVFMMKRVEEDVEEGVEEMFFELVAFLMGFV